VGPHGLPLVSVGAIVAGAAAAWRAPAHARRRAALLVGGLYLAHWLCDAITGRKPTWPGGPIVGLDLYRRPVADFAFEAAVVAAGWLLWRGSLPSGGRRVLERALPWLALAALLVLQALANRAMARGGRACCDPGGGACGRARPPWERAVARRGRATRRATTGGRPAD
jgi:hypothetical protein